MRTGQRRRFAGFIMDSSYQSAALDESDESDTLYQPFLVDMLFLLILKHLCEIFRRG